MGPVPKFKNGDKVRCTKEGDFRKGTVIHDYHSSAGPYYLLVSDRGIVWSEHAMHLELTETKQRMITIPVQLGMFLPKGSIVRNLSEVDIPLEEIYKGLLKLGAEAIAETNKK